MAEEESQIPPITGKNVGNIAKAVSHYKTILRSDRSATTYQQELTARQQFLRTKGVHQSWWDDNGLAMDWDTRLRELKKKDPETYERVIKSINLALDISDQSNQKGLNKLIPKPDIKFGPLKTMVSQTKNRQQRGMFDEFASFFGSRQAPPTDTNRRSNKWVPTQKSEEEIRQTAEAKLRKEQKIYGEEERLRLEKEKEALRQKAEREENERRIKEIKVHADKRATEVVNVLYSREGRERAQKLLDDLVSVQKGLFDREDPVRAQILNQVDSFRTEGSGNLSQTIAGGKLLDKWRRDHPVKDGNYAQRDKEEKEYFGELTLLCRDIAQARQIDSNGKKAVLIPKRENTAYPMYTTSEDINLYRETFYARFATVRDESDLKNDKAWFMS